MDAKTFFDNFGTIANAPGGVARLRELILDLAVRGELFSSDRHAWKSSTLGEAVEIIRGVTFPASAKQRTPGKGLIPCLRTTNVQNEVEWDDLLYISDEYVRKNSQYVQMDDVLISMANSRELVGKVALVRRDDIRCTLGGFIAAIRCGGTILPRFLIALLRVPAAREKLIDSSTQTTNIANISLGRLNPFELSLPPMEEQKLIVAKVDELMALCDELEAAHQKRNSIRAAARKSAIDAISTATTPEELDAAWMRISDNWLTIADTPKSISSLRSLILDLAIRGHLLPELTPTTRNDNGLPIDWKSETLEEAADYVQRGKGPKYVVKSDVAVVSQKCVKWSGFDISEARFIDPSSLAGYKEDRFLRSGDLLWNSTGTGTVGRTALFYEEASFPKAVADSHVTVIRTSKILPRFLWIWSASPSIQAEVLGSTTGSTNQQELNLSTIKNLVLDIPPIGEQKRIVAKVDEIMALCDQLERSLFERDELAKKIAGAMTAEVAA